jgi:hypothetical protein
MFDVSLQVQVDGLADLDEVEALRIKVQNFLDSEPRARLHTFSTAEVINS